MVKTPVTYTETLQGILEMREIESIVSDNLAKLHKFVFRDFKKLPISQDTVKHLHQLLCANLFAETGKYRRHNVQLGAFEPPSCFRLPELMKTWEDDYQERKKHAQAKEQKYQLCAWLMHRLLWIHPFFDYNGRISRLLGELFLLQNNLPIVSFQKTGRGGFVQAMKHATETNDLAPLIRLLQK